MIQENMSHESIFSLPHASFSYMTKKRGGGLDLDGWPIQQIRKEDTNE